MLPPPETPLIRLENLFPGRVIYAKCEFLAPSGCFKIRGAMRLLEHLQHDGKHPPLIVPSMGNTALGAAEGAKLYGFKMIAVVPLNLARAKEARLQAMGVELVKITGGGSDLLRRANELAQERGGYFVHPHLDPFWTDGYRGIAAQIIKTLPECRSLVFPLGGGGLLMGLTEYFRRHPANVRLYGCEPYTYPKYATFTHSRSETMADGLKVENPHPPVQQRIAEDRIEVSMIPESDIAAALKDLFDTQALLVEPSSAISTAFVKLHPHLPEPVCVILTGGNIAPEDHARLRSQSAVGSRQ